MPFILKRANMELACSFFHINTRWVSRETKRQSIRLWSASKKVIPATIVTASISPSPFPLTTDEKTGCTKDSAPCEKEEEETPPPYTCTVYKMGYVRLKKELNTGGRRSNDRSWRTLYLSLQGTVLFVYTYKSGSRPLMQLSMQHAHAGLAADYKESGALRLRLPSGEQYLMKTDTLHAAISWIEHLQASANISLDLDVRTMPRILTMPRQNHASPNVASVSLGLGARAVVSVCRST